MSGKKSPLPGNEGYRPVLRAESPYHWEYL